MSTHGRTLVIHETATTASKRTFVGLKRVIFRESVAIAALTVLMVALWCKVYHVNSFASLGISRAYWGDGVLNMGLIKAYRDGEITPWAFQTVHSLDAPFAANWNDYPTSEKMLPYCLGIIARVVGLHQAFNLGGLMAIVLAAVAFYITCRMLKYQWIFSFVGAAMFGFSHYMVARFMYHLSLNYYWHIPLCLLVTWWCCDKRELPVRSPRWWFAVAVGALTGLQAIYYAYIFWQFLGFAVLLQFLQRNKTKALSIISIATISVGFTGLMAAPFVVYKVLHGSNASAVQRSLANLQVFGLQLPELFLPPFHRWNTFVAFAQSHYFLVTSIRGEMGFSYLGLIGIVGFVWLFGYGLFRLLQGKTQAIPLAFWQSLWVVLYSVVGGINLLIGVVGLQLFRGTNRYSVVLLCLALLFLVRQLGRKCPKPYRLVLAVSLLAVGCWDVLPPFWTRQQVSAIETAIVSDRDFVNRLERSVPSDTMVFQIPVMDFPESGGHLGILDYAYLRPYLYSKALRFSYGSDKGRPREGWQHQVEADAPGKMVGELEQYGFGAIVVDRKGYPDGASSILKDLELNGGKVIGQDALGEFVAVGLRPKLGAASRWPDVPPYPGPGFYIWEGDWRAGGHTWSMGNATLILTNASKVDVEKDLTFIIGSLAKRVVTVITPTEKRVVPLDAGNHTTVGPMKVRLPPGETRIMFETDAPPVLAGNGDQRLLAFDLELRQQP